jgi:hypothetical protein
MSLSLPPKINLATRYLLPKPFRWIQQDLSFKKTVPFILNITHARSAGQSTVVGSFHAASWKPSSPFTTPRTPRIATANIPRNFWRRDIHVNIRNPQEATRGRKNETSTPSNQNNPSTVQDKSHSPPKGVESKDANALPTPSKYLHLPHMPKMPHRPTKEELLAAATGFWSRMKVRFKWFSIRSVRPWNVDDWSAFVSWFVLGNIVWIFVGTTTFFSLVILSINTVVAQGKTFASSYAYSLI